MGATYKEAGVDMTKSRVKRLSLVSEHDADFANLKIMFDGKVEGSFTTDDARKIAEKTVDIFSTENKLKRIGPDRGGRWKVVDNHPTSTLAE